MNREGRGIFRAAGARLLRMESYLNEADDRLVRWTKAKTERFFEWERRSPWALRLWSAIVVALSVGVLAYKL